MGEGRHTTLADHFQTLDWLLNNINIAKQKFEELYQDAQRNKQLTKDKDTENFTWLAAAPEVSWQKCEDYFKKADNSPAYYTAILLNPTLKNYWYDQAWGDYKEKRP